MRASRFVHGQPVGWAATVLLLTWSSSALALINPNYMPVDLVNQSKTILRVEVAVSEGKVHACLAVELFEPGEPCLLSQAVPGGRFRWRWNLRHRSPAY